MELYKQNTTYQVVDMIEGMLDVSRIKDRQFQNRREGDLQQWYELCVTSFSFGRQAGHTEGAIKYLYKDTKAYLVVHSHVVKLDLVGLNPILCNRIISVDSSHKSLGLIFRGLTDIHFIMDSCSSDQCIKFTKNIAPIVQHVDGMIRIGS